MFQLLVLAGQVEEEVVPVLALVVAARDVTSEHVRLLGEHALCNIEVAGAVTVGNKGENLAPLAELAAAAESVRQYMRLGHDVAVTGVWQYHRYNLSYDHNHDPNYHHNYDPKYAHNYNPNYYHNYDHNQK